jgi:hypothetical protein
MSKKAIVNVYLDDDGNSVFELDISNPNYYHIALYDKVGEDDGKYIDIDPTNFKKIVNGLKDALDMAEKHHTKRLGV